MSVFTKLVYQLLYRWNSGEGNYVTATEDIWKALLVKAKDTYGVFLFVRLERPSDMNQIEGELTPLESNLYSIIRNETVDGWTLFGGKHMESLDYLSPDELFSL
jgi:hypothetical protein